MVSYLEKESKCNKFHHFSLNTVPKKDTTERRAILDRSFPPGSAVNNFISKAKNEMYVWFLLSTYPYFFNPTLNIKMVFGEKNTFYGHFFRFCYYFLCSML